MKLAKRTGSIRSVDGTVHTPEPYRKMGFLESIRHSLQELDKHLDELFAERRAETKKVQEEAIATLIEKYGYSKEEAEAYIL